MSGIHLYAGVTDWNWYSFLASRPGIDEVNFWRPGGGAINTERGTPFLFKLKSPYNAIAGGGFFEMFQRMSLGMAWEFYGERNGAPDYKTFSGLISSNRRAATTTTDEIGCIILSEPFFFTRDEWIAAPPDWSGQIVSFKKYDLLLDSGKALWSQVEKRLATSAAPGTSPGLFGGLGNPTLYLPRRGQGTFRKLVLEAYENRCAITGERTLPVLQASHIKPFADVVTHDIRNGLALRADIHTLFDRGYVTVTPDYKFHVSKRIREEFENGRDYYRLDGCAIRLPADETSKPLQEHLDWHSAEVFKKG